MTIRRRWLAFGVVLVALSLPLSGQAAGSMVLFVGTLAELRAALPSTFLQQEFCVQPAWGTDHVRRCAPFEDFLAYIVTSGEVRDGLPEPPPGPPLQVLR